MDRLDAFMADYVAGTGANFLSPRTRVFMPGVVLLEVNKFAGTIRLGSIQSNYEPSHGHATAAVVWLKGLADKHGVQITGTVKAYGQSSVARTLPKTKRLLIWYVRNGFRKTGGNETDGYDIVYGKEV